MLPIFETARLKLRGITDRDEELLYRLSNNPNILKYINGGRTYSLEETRLDLAKRLAITNDSFGYWMVFEKDNDEFIGWVALKPLDQTRQIEVGYRLLEEHWDRGYATEASAELLRYAFEVLQLREVVAVVLPENENSIKVLRKLGLTYRRRGRYYGYNCLYFSLSKPEAMGH